MSNALVSRAEKPTAEVTPTTVNYSFIRASVMVSRALYTGISASPTGRRELRSLRSYRGLRVETAMMWRLQSRRGQARFYVDRSPLRRYSDDRQ